VVVVLVVVVVMWWLWSVEGQGESRTHVGGGRVGSGGGVVWVRDGGWRSKSLGRTVLGVVYGLQYRLSHFEREEREWRRRGEEEGCVNRILKEKFSWIQEQLHYI